MNIDQCLEDDYSLKNKFYPLTSLESEMERLFGSPVYQENKECIGGKVSTVYPDPLGRGRSLYDSSSPKSCEDFYRPYQLFQPSRQEDIQLPSASQRQVSHAPATSSSTSPFYSPFSSTLSAEAPAFVQHFRKFAPFTTPLHSQPQAATSYPRDLVETEPNHNQIANVNSAFPWANRFQKRPKPKPCKFCFKNGERPYVYNSHQLKDEHGVVTCPILRRYVCPICGATGGIAHTRKYCPLNNDVEEILLPVYRRLSNGLVTTSHNHK